MGSAVASAHLLGLDAERLRHALGIMVDPGFAFKLFPSQHATHFGIAAALDLYRQEVRPEEVLSVRVHTPVMPYRDRPSPHGIGGKV